MDYDKMNFSIQYYKGIPIQLIKRNYEGRMAYRYAINHTNQNVWIPKKHLFDDGSLIPTENIDYVFRRARRQLEIAGLHQPIIGIKRRTTPQ